MNRIIKISTNNVEVTPSKDMIDIDGKTFTIWDEERTQSYGQDRLDAEKANIDIRKAALIALDPVQDKTDKLQDVADEEVEHTKKQEAMDE